MELKKHKKIKIKKQTVCRRGKTNYEGRKLRELTRKELKQARKNRPSTQCNVLWHSLETLTRQAAKWKLYTTEVQTDVH